MPGAQSWGYIASDCALCRRVGAKSVLHSTPNCTWEANIKLVSCCESSFTWKAEACSVSSEMRPSTPSELLSGKQRSRARSKCVHSAAVPSSGLCFVSSVLLLWQHSKGWGDGATTLAWLILVTQRRLTRCRSYRCAQDFALLPFNTQM